jgi:hypothetical protein
MRVNVRAAAVGVLLLRVPVIVRVGVIGECVGVVHVGVRESVRLGELRRVQDRQLGTAEHRNGKQRRNHDLLHDPFHGASKAGARRRVKSSSAGSKKYRRGEGNCHNLTVTV